LDTNFDPGGTVNRGQMAAFITRALAHTSARPEGLTAQALSDGAVLVSVRDDKFAAVANTWVEVFHVNADDEDDAFDSDGKCSGLGDSPNGTHECEIDGGDLLTNGDGDAETQAITVGDGVVTWAWTGDVGDAVDDDTTLYRLPIDKATAPAESGTTAAISNDLAGNTAKMGSSVTVTLQLQNADGEDVTGGAHDKDEPAEWVVYVQTHVFTRVGAAPAGIVNGPAVLTSTLQLKSDSDGKATFTLASLPDRNPNTDGDAWRVSYDIRATCSPNDAGPPPDGWDEASCKAPNNGTGTFASGELPDAAVTDGDADTSNDHEGNVVFSDEDAVTTSVSIDTSSYVQVASRAGRTALNRAKVTVSDQFGDPVRGVKVTLTSSDGATDDTDDTDGASSLTATGDANTPKPFTTGSDGSYTFGYTWLGDSGDTETLVASHDPTPDADPDDNNTISTDAADGDDPVQVRWAEDAGTSEDGTVVDGDVEANEIVVTISGEDAPVILTYDDDDRLNTSDAAASASEPASMAAFEKMLAAALKPGADALMVTWSNYMNRPRHTSVITLHVS
jgi:hypothetical protein